MYSTGTQSSCLFFSHLKAHLDGRKAPTKSGPQPFIKPDQYDEVRDYVSDKSKSMRSLTPHQFNSTLRDYHKVHNQSNQRSEPSVSAETIRRLKKSIGVIEVTSADTKASHRVDSFENLRTQLSFAVLLRHLQKLIDQSLYVSSDDVSILVNKFDKPHVISTKDAIAYCEKHNIGISTLEDQQQERVLTFNCSITGGNELICNVIKFSDRCFTSLNQTLAVFDMGDGFHVILYCHGMSDTVVNTYMYNCCIIPEATKLRERLIAKHMEGLKRSILSTDSQPMELTADEVPVMTEPDVRAKFKWILLMMDGAYGQIKAVLDSVIERSVRLGLNLMIGKTAGGASMIQSVNDSGAGHQILHSLFTNNSFRYDDDFDVDPTSPQWIQLKSTLRRKMEPASFRTVWKAMTQAELFLKTAFTPKNIRSAFLHAGVYPLNVDLILDACPHYNKMQTEDAQFVIGCLPQFDQVFEQYGYVPETEYERILHFREGVDNCPAKMGKPLNEMNTSRQRAMLISHPTYLEHLQMNTASEESIRTNAMWRKERVVHQQQLQQAAQEVHAAAVQKKRGPNKVICSNPMCCARNFDGSWKELGWEKCKTKQCNIAMCADAACRELMQKHKAWCCDVVM